MATRYVVRKEKFRGRARHRVWKLEPGERAVKVSRTYVSEMAAEFERRKLESSNA